MSSTPQQRFVNDPNSPGRKRARALARADEWLRANLLHARKLAGLSQKEVAERMGVSQPTVASFERYDNDPRLSTIRRYANAVGATVTHQVWFDDAEVDCSWNSMGTAQVLFMSGVEEAEPYPVTLVAPRVAA